MTPLTHFLNRLLSSDTVYALKLDLLRARVRFRGRHRNDLVPPAPLLHLGCGGRRVKGWLNADLTDSDCDVDLAGGRLPWKNAVFTAVVAQHTIEHLELFEQLLPLLREVRRVLKPGGEVWLTCPDIEKICRSYIDNRMQDLVADRIKRRRVCDLGGAPSSQLINDFFHLRGPGPGKTPHKNLFDFELLDWALRQAGFASVTRMSEQDFLARFPEFPPRRDEAVTLTVRGVA